MGNKLRHKKQGTLITRCDLGWWTVHHVWCFSIREEFTSQCFSLNWRDLWSFLSVTSPSASISTSTPTQSGSGWLWFAFQMVFYFLPSTSDAHLILLRSLGHNGCFSALTAVVRQKRKDAFSILNLYTAHLIIGSPLISKVCFASRQIRCIRDCFLRSSIWLIDLHSVSCYTQQHSRWVLWYTSS